ncbi:class II fructose-bisphosphate aldolase [Candidatus Bipolaricaulota bacterium]|jgi:fructose-bisphosphate aldolase class II|nr:class II fructose-bisphosphate aldolase [Candidatus Bipolaricaulota bacterium]
MPFCGGDRLLEAYRLAQRDGYAFMANNVAESNIFLGLIAAYTEARSDLLVQISPGAAKFAGGGDKQAGLRALSRMIQEIANAFPICVFINLDHFTVNERDLIEDAIEHQLVSSIMIDASKEPFDDNVRICREVADRAAGTGILIEAELGKIKGVEDEISSDDALYTNPEEAVEFVQRTNADLLAISVGTQHGVSKGRTLDLRVDLAGKIRERLLDSGLKTPLVLHGSSGLLPEQVREMIENGICKLNKDTQYQYVYGRAACEFYRDHADAMIPPANVEDDILNLFAASDWSPDKSQFDPRVVGRSVQSRIGDIATQLIQQAGSGGKTLVSEKECAS